MSKKIVILGSNGFLGHSLFKFYQYKGLEVTGVQRTKPDSHETGKIQLDYRDYSGLEELIREADVVYHLGGSATPSSSLANPTEDLLENLVPNIKIFEICANNSVGRIVFPSSGGSVYGQANIIPTPESADLRPLSAYAVGLLATEAHLQLFSANAGLRSNVLRLSNPYGPGQVNKRLQGFISAAINASITNTSLDIWGDGEHTRDFIFIDDTVEAIFLAGEQEVSNLVLNIGTGAETTLNQILKIVEAISGKKIDRNYLPGRKVDVNRSSLDVSKASTYLGWEPKESLVTGIQKTFDWMLKKG